MAAFSRNESQEAPFTTLRPFSIILKDLNGAMIEEGTVAHLAIRTSRLSQLSLLMVWP
jgi:hypothetical protein